MRLVQMLKTGYYLTWKGYTYCHYLNASGSRRGRDIFVERVSGGIAK